jgi:PiT family inorganic phosphate transporter
MKFAKLSSDKNKLVVAKEERARRKLVRRSQFMSIIAAWIITVPSAAVISGVIYSAIVFSMG